MGVGKLNEIEIAGETMHRGGERVRGAYDGAHQQRAAGGQRGKGTQNTLKSITSSRQSEIGCVKVIIKSSLPLTVYYRPTSSRSQFNGHRNHRRFFFTSVSAPAPDDINISAAKGSL